MFYAQQKVYLPYKTMTSACLALGRLSEAAKRAEIAPLWALRETAFTVAGVWSAAAPRISEEEILGVLCQIDRVRIRDRGNLRRAFDFWKLCYRSWFPRRAPITASSPARQNPFRPVSPGEPFGPAADILEVMGEFEIEPTPVMETLLRIRETLRCDHPVAHVRLAAPLAFQDTIGVVLPALALSFEARSHLNETDWVEASFQKLQQTCEDAYQRLEQLNFAWARWNEQLPSCRTHSALPDVLLMLVRSPALTSRLVAASLDISRQAAARHLATLERAHIVREITTRKAWKIYFAEGLARPRWPGPIQRQRTVMTPPPLEEGRTISRAQPRRNPLPPIDYEAFEREVAEAQRELDAAMAALSDSVLGNKAA